MLVLAIDVVFLVVAFGLRTLVQRRRTGDSGWRLGRPNGPAEAVARLSMLGGGVLAGTALVVTEVASPWVFVAGSTIAVLSVAFVSVAQLQMGSSWRIGVDPHERTALVTSGLYAVVRNPIYTGMVAFTVGQAVMLPGIWSVAAAVVMGVGVEVQVRLVEEPYLRAAHGAAFEAWTTRAGRFVPRVRS